MRSLQRLSAFLLLALLACNQATQEQAGSTAAAPALSGQSGVKDDVSQMDVVKVAVSSADHTTLVAALKAAEYVDVLTNAGPFTVFAPTNAAFDALPAGTLDELVKPEKKADLQNILEYHVYVGKITADKFKDGMTLNQVNLKNVTINVKDGKATVNGANIVATVPAANGVIHVIDAVLLPPAK
jgi:uncharacterized surface protein with fasciclin (FAS1) repeats